MDHRPTSIEAHARLPIDVQVSGHVHNGQVAPANLIVRTLYRLAYGYEAIGKRPFSSPLRATASGAFPFVGFAIRSVGYRHQVKALK